MSCFDIYDNYDGVNNVKTINDNAGIAPVEVDKELIDLLELSREEYELTSGKVNVAMGSVLSIWHTYRRRALQTRPRQRSRICRSLSRQQNIWILSRCRSIRRHLRFTCRMKR